MSMRSLMHSGPQPVRKHTETASVALAPADEVKT